MPFPPSREMIAGMWGCFFLGVFVGPNGSAPVMTFCQIAWLVSITLSIYLALRQNPTDKRHGKICLILNLVIVAAVILLLPSHPKAPPPAPVPDDPILQSR